MTADEPPRFEQASYATLKHVGRLEEKIRRLEADARSATVALGQQLAALRQSLATDGTPHRRRRLESLAAEERGAALAALQEWVAWLVRTYELELAFPACWARHHGIVEELRALAEWHTALYGDLADDPRAHTSWHEAFVRFRLRALPGVLNRCVARHHESADGEAEESPGDAGSGGSDASAAGSIGRGDRSLTNVDGSAKGAVVVRSDPPGRVERRGQDS